MWTTILTLFYVAWLIAVLVLLWLIWRDSVNRAAQLDKTLIEATLKASEAAKQAAEAARILAEQHQGSKNA